jgi:hypothetical protein
MTLISRQPPVESGVQVITVSDYLNRRLRDDHIPPSVNRVAVIKGIRFEKMTEYDAQIPPAKSRLSDQTVHRESLLIQADYDAHIPPTSKPAQYRDSFEIQAEYDAQIPLHQDRLDASTLHDQAQYEHQSPPNLTNFSVHFQAHFKRHIPLTFLQKRITFFNAFVHHSTEPFLTHFSNS